MKKSKLSMLAVLAIAITVAVSGCPGTTPQYNQTIKAPVAATGVKKAVAKIDTDINGFTVEQKNVKKRLEADNAIGAIKHMYIFSVTTGDVILYSTVDGKVTSSGKRLTPTQVAAGYYHTSSNSQYSGSTSGHPYGMRVNIGGGNYITPEVLQDDGTYGHSIRYLYWWDTKGIYHQQYVEGCMIHLSDAPIRGAKPKLILCELSDME